MTLENRHPSILATDRRRLRFALLGLVLVAATIAAYIPSLGGGFIWDDPDYVVNNPTLRSFGGLVTMWTNIYSLPQWYPLVHTTFWIEYQLFGLVPLAYKVTNLALHIASALLLWRLLLKLQVPGAFMAAAVFALHPVQVESVAWITERKNALSGLFYLAAFLSYLKTTEGALILDSGDELAPPRSRNWYFLTIGLFACALLSKTVTASFPAAVLVVTWWKTGSVRWRSVKPLLPMFAMGVAMGLITASLERYHVGAVGSEWDYSTTWYGELAVRTLIAGRAVWFYVGKLLWPNPIAFMYERWTIDAHDWQQWLFPVAAVVVILGLALGRRWFGRGPIAAVLLFVGTLFPALGFFNVFPHRYSFVADHFQHLASIAITSLICAGIGLALRSANQLWLCVVVQGALIVALGSLTYRQGFAYKTESTLWEDVRQKSPRSWVAYTNLGKLAEDAGERDAAIAYHQKALDLAPFVADTWYNMAAVYATREEWQKAVEAFNRTIELSEAKPWSAVNLDALIGLARIAMLRDGNAADAESFYKRAIAIRGDYPPARLHYARFLQRRSRAGEAIEQYAELVELTPENYSGRAELGTLLLNVGQYTAAVEQLEIATRLDPASPETWTNLGFAQLRSGLKSRAATSFERALLINPAAELARKGLEEARK